MPRFAKDGERGGRGGGGQNVKDEDDSRRRRRRKERDKNATLSAAPEKDDDDAVDFEPQHRQAAGNLTKTLVFGEELNVFHFLCE